MTANSCVTHSRSRRVTSAGNFIPCIRIICNVKMRKSDIIQLGAQPTLKTHFVVQTQTERQATLKRGHRLTWIHERMCACLCLCLCILKTWARHPFSPASSRWFAAELQYINIWTCYAAHSAHQRSRAGAHRMQEFSWVPRRVPVRPALNSGHTKLFRFKYAFLSPHKNGCKATKKTAVG